MGKLWHRTSVFKLSFFCAIFLAHGLAICEDRQFVSKSDMEVAATGKKWEHIRVADNQKIVWDLKAGGTMFGNNRTTNSSDSGTWMINDKAQLCIKWRKNSEDRCVALVKNGDDWIMADSADLQGAYARLTRPPF